MRAHTQRPSQPGRSPRHRRRRAVQRFQRRRSSTGWMSVGDFAITCSISLVAVCCSSVSASSWLRLHLVEQADVFDRDHGLVGEGLDQFDLLVSNALTLNRTRLMTPNGLAFTQ